MDGDKNGDLGFQLRGGVSSSGINTVPLYENVGGMTMGSMPMFKSSNGGDTFFGSGWDPFVSMSEGVNFVGSSSVFHSEFDNPNYPNNISHVAHHYQSADVNLVEMVPKLSHSQFNPNMNPEGEEQKMEISDESNELLKDQDEEKLKKTSANLRGKQTKDNSQSGEEAPKENYVHMRARRGQATNSHSLAERVRREKISERMRMLQELVPGCNKITGKAVMLDEIINYVQSLQQQVEFLSMKLATVNPELNIDLDQALPKDILHSRGGNTALLGMGPGANTSYSNPHGILTPPQFHSMPQTVWDNEIQSFLHTGYDSNPAAGNDFQNQMYR